MEPHGELEAARNKANAFLQDLLRRAPVKTPQELARSITNLALEENNPVRELFAQAISQERGRPSSPQRTLKSRASSIGLLRGLTRREPKSSSGSKSSSSNSQVGDARDLPLGSRPIFQEFFGPSSPCSSTCGSKKQSKPKATSASSTSAKKSSTVPNTTKFLASEEFTKSLASVRYRCIVCDDELSSKGVCKRHVEDQHVSPKLYSCERCKKRFDAKTEAKKHCSTCRHGGMEDLGDFSYITVRPDAKKFYACEYTGERFTSLPKYLDHLVSLCEQSEQRPKRNMHRKLCALLDQPNLVQHAEDISARVHGSKDAWRSLQWSETQISKAIEQLDYATVQENGTIEFGSVLGDSSQKVQPARLYLNSLLCAGYTAQSNNSHSRQQTPRPLDLDTRTRRSSISSTVSTATATPAPTQSSSLRTASALSKSTQASTAATSVSSASSVDSVSSIASDVKGKRHLSDYSRFYVPPRQPPGPPVPPVPPYMVSQASNTSVQDVHLPHIPNVSTTSLPFRRPDAQQPVHAAYEIGRSQAMHDYSASDFRTLTAPNPTNESTLSSTYQQPLLTNPSPFLTGFWPTHQNLDHFDFTFDTPATYGTPAASMYYPGDASIRTSSIDTDYTDYTDQTYVDFNEHEQKFLQYEAVDLHPAAQYGTFLLDDDDHGIT